jgi:hypothetical protein
MSDVVDSLPQLETHPYNSLDIPPTTTLLIVGTAPPPRFSQPRSQHEGPKSGLDADFFYGSEYNMLWSYLKLAAGEPDFAEPGSAEARQENTEALMRDYLLRHRMWMHDILQTYVRKPGKSESPRDADLNLNDGRTTFMNFPAVLEVGKKIERVVFTGVKVSDWFFGRVLNSCFCKDQAEAYRRLFLDANARRKAKLETDEQYTDEFCRAEFLGKTIRFHIAPSPSGSSRASDDPWFSDIYRQILFEELAMRRASA